MTRYEELFAHVLLDAQTGRGRARPAKNEMMMDFLLLSKPLKLSRLGHPAGPLLEDHWKLFDYSRSPYRRGVSLSSSDSRPDEVVTLAPKKKNLFVPFSFPPSNSYMKEEEQEL